jgi:hypothetical protein
MVNVSRVSNGSVPTIPSPVIQNGRWYPFPGRVDRIHSVVGEKGRDLGVRDEKHRRGASLIPGTVRTIDGSGNGEAGVAPLAHLVVDGFVVFTDVDGVFDRSRTARTDTGGERHVFEVCPFERGVEDFPGGVRDWRPAGGR